VRTLVPARTREVMSSVFFWPSKSYGGVSGGGVDGKWGNGTICPSRRVRAWAMRGSMVEYWCID